MAVADRLGFGMSATGRMVGIKEVANGLECRCVCPACRAPLIARQGGVRRWHFSHAPGFVVCGSGPETALHRMAKQIIAEWDEVNLPPLDIRVSRRSADGQSVVRNATIPSAQFIVEESVIEARREGFVPDVLLHGANGQLLAVEVCVTHKVGRTKQQRVARCALPMIQFSVATFDDWTGGPKELEQHLRTATPEWIFHPQEARLRQQLEAEVEGELLRLRREQAARLLEARVELPGTNDLFAGVDERRTSSHRLKAHTEPQHVEVLGCCIVINVATTTGIWALTADQRLQTKIVDQITADAGVSGLRVTERIHTGNHGVLLVTGAAVRNWAEGVAHRLKQAFPDNVTTEEFES